MTTVSFPRAPSSAPRQIVTGLILGDPPADLAERRAAAEARERPIKTTFLELNPGLRRKNT